MASQKPNLPDPGKLAEHLREALLKERIIPRFVDSYVVEHGRYALQVHAALYRDLLALLQREGLLALTARALENACNDSTISGKYRERPNLRRDAPVFRGKFLTALARQQKWTAGDALDFQSDLLMYEQLIARSAATRRSRKPFEAANHPFVDRCAFVLDSSFMELARLAASKALRDIEKLADETVATRIQSDTIAQPR